MGKVIKSKSLDDATYDIHEELQRADGDALRHTLISFLSRSSQYGECHFQFTIEQWENPQNGI